MREFFVCGKIVFREYELGDEVEIKIIGEFKRLYPRVLEGEGWFGKDVDNEGSIFECRKNGFDILEKTEGFLENLIHEGSYGELWSLRKMIRRFIWHDRIHAKAMWRMAKKTFPGYEINNVFYF